MKLAFQTMRARVVAVALARAAHALRCSAPRCALRCSTPRWNAYTTTRWASTPDDDHEAFWRSMNTQDEEAALPPPPKPAPKAADANRRLHDAARAYNSVSQWSPGGGDDTWSPADGDVYFVPERAEQAPERVEQAPERAEAPPAAHAKPRPRRRTLYDELFCAPGAPTAALRAGFKKAAKLHHPDAEGRDEARFAAASRAWHVLRDPERRARYDAELGLTDG